ncbi:MAG TPA: DUF2946 family protein [Stellaceae bacterium]|nr:DUF2946 family protein [Stellaceae bacterium]
MRRQRRGWSGWAAWLGVIALGLNALVPIHFAFDLAEALEQSDHTPAEIANGLDRQLLALICDHDQSGDAHHGKHSDRGCPVCAAAGSLIAFALVAGAPLPVPIAIAVRPDAAAIVEQPRRAPTAAYRSRAPPLA